MQAVYGFSANIVGASTGAYVSISFSSGKSESSSFSATPTALAYVFYSDEGISLTWQAGPGESGAGAAVMASDAIAGSIIISPPVNMPLEIIVRGAGNIVGTHTTPAGQTQDSFNIAVNPSDALPQDQVRQFLKSIKPKQ